MLLAHNLYSTMTPSKPRIFSITNALAYGLNALQMFGYGPFSSGFSSDQNNASVSQKYQTIITPNDIAFSIWGLIFLAQSICVSSTLVSERQMTHPLIVKGVSFWYPAVCILQTAWSLAFAYEKIPLSAALMGCILLGLVLITVRQYNVVTNILERETNEIDTHLTWNDYWLLQLPLELQPSS